MNISNTEPVLLPSNQKFGFFFTAVFAIVGIYLFAKHSSDLSYVFFILATLFLIVTLIKADFLLPLNKLWMQLGLLLGRIVNPIIVGIIFFALFTPISLFMRLFGRDELRLKLSGKGSHWKKCDALVEKSNTFKNQY